MMLFPTRAKFKLPGGCWLPGLSTRIVRLLQKEGSGGGLESRTAVPTCEVLMMDGRLP